MDRIIKYTRRRIEFSKVEDLYWNFSECFYSSRAGPRLEGS